MLFLEKSLVDGAGFEPATSAMPTLKMGLESVFKQYDKRFLRMENKLEYVLRIENAEALLEKFKDFMRINMQLRPTTVQHTAEDIKRFLKKGNNIVSYETVANYLRGYLNKAPKTYNQQITSLRRFIRDFLGAGHIISSFKLAPVDEPKESTDVTKAQVRKGFYAQKDALSKAIYLFTATTGLRKSEILSLLKTDVDFKTRAVRPRHFTRKKRSGITFYNKETEKWLKEYLKDNAKFPSFLSSLLLPFQYLILCKLVSNQQRLFRLKISLPTLSLTQFFQRQLVPK